MVSLLDQWLIVGVFMMVNIIWAAFAQLTMGWWASTAGSVVLFGVCLRLMGAI